MLSTDHLALDVNKINLNALSLSGEDKFGSGGSNFSRYAETTHLGAGVSANSASGTVGDKQRFHVIKKQLQKFTC